MPLPPGFKVNGSKSTTSQMPIPPRVQKILAYLDGLAADELATTMELSERLIFGVGGSYTNHPALVNYREKVDGKLFWGSRKAIAKLRAQLNAPEETNGEN